MTILTEAKEVRSLYRAMKETSKAGGAILAGAVAAGCILERVVNAFLPTYRGFTNLKRTKEVYERFSK